MRHAPLLGQPELLSQKKISELDEKVKRSC